MRARNNNKKEKVAPQFPWRGMTFSWRWLLFLELPGWLIFLKRQGSGACPPLLPWQPLSPALSSPRAAPKCGRDQAALNSAGGPLGRGSALRAGGGNSSGGAYSGGAYSGGAYSGLRATGGSAGSGLRARGGSSGVARSSGGGGGGRSGSGLGADAGAGRGGSGGGSSGRGGNWGLFARGSSNTTDAAAHGAGGGGGGWAALGHSSGGDSGANGLAAALVRRPFKAQAPLGRACMLGHCSFSFRFPLARPLGLCVLSPPSTPTRTSAAPISTMSARRRGASTRPTNGAI